MVDLEDGVTSTPGHTVVTGQKRGSKEATYSIKYRARGSYDWPLGIAVRYNIYYQY